MVLGRHIFWLFPSFKGVPMLSIHIDLVVWILLKLWPNTIFHTKYTYAPRRTCTGNSGRWKTFYYFTRFNRFMATRSTCVLIFVCEFVYSTEQDFSKADSILHPTDRIILILDGSINRTLWLFNGAYSTGTIITLIDSFYECNICGGVQVKSYR